MENLFSGELNPVKYFLECGHHQNYFVERYDRLFNQFICFSIYVHFVVYNNSFNSLQYKSNDETTFLKNEG